jgi:hypothetical protein
MTHRRSPLIPVIAFLLWGAVPALADTIFVRVSGNDQADGRTPATAFRTLLRAVQGMNHGDSIVIGPGQYRESVVLAERFGSEETRLSIVGDEGGKRTGDRPGPVVIQPLASNDPALRIHRSRHLTITGLTMRGPGQGIVLEKCIDAVIERSTFEHLFNGITLQGTEHVRVESSVLSGCMFGLVVRSASETRLAHLTLVQSTSTGVLVLTSGKGSIRNSILVLNNSSLVSDPTSAASWTSDFNVIHGPVGAWGAVPTIAHVHEWYAASGQDRHSVHVVPTFAGVRTGDFHLDPAVRWGGGLPGWRVGCLLEPGVEWDRDGQPFRGDGDARSAGAYDYPDPRPAGGWGSLPVTLEGKGPRQSAGVYRPDGTLVSTLLADAAGVRTLWWDGRDDLEQAAAADRYELRSVTHDVRLLDDGAIGDNGNPLGTFNCDNADRAVVLPDGGFLLTAIYDEAGMTLRRHASSGQPIYASALTEGGFWGLAVLGEDVIGGLGKGTGAKLVRLVLPGERAPMATGAESFALFAADEKGSDPAGLAVLGRTACVSLPKLGVIRVIDLDTGQKRQDWAVPGLGDLAGGGPGILWALSGKEIVSVEADGKVGKRYPTGLESPEFLAAGAGRLAAVDRRNSRISVLDASDGRILKTMGRDRRTAGLWSPVEAELFRDPRGAAYFPDGKLLVTEASRVRVFWPEPGRIAYECLSNFMESAVVHPTRPDYVVCGLGVFEVDPKTGAWHWRVETPPYQSFEDEKGRAKLLGSPTNAVVLDGRPFVVYFNPSRVLTFVDVSDPLKPRVALEYRNEHKVLSGWAYATIAFTRGGDLVTGVDNTLKFRRISYRGLDPEGHPTFDFAASKIVGPDQDPGPRGMKHISAVSCDKESEEIYALAVTSRHHKMVPGWGADGTGVGKSASDGRPLWFSLSSGGNYMSLSTVHDGRNVWTLAGKSFGGQLDLFDTDGLRLATGNWSWPSHYSIGFVDLRFGVHGYLRPDGKVGAYVEDDAIGRFARCRMDGASTVDRKRAPFEWKGAPGASPGPEETGGREARRPLAIPRVPALKVDGDWKPWQEAGVEPQMVLLPTNVGFKRTMPDNLLESFRAGTAIGALAHDGTDFYAYFLVADDTPRFDAERSEDLWKFDGIELWLEEEQFGLGLLRNGSPGLHKFRFHDRAGTEWKGNYALPRGNIWGRTVADLSQHPLGRRLSAITGASFAGKPGYAVMGKIPFAEVKLVGGIGDRKGGVAAMTGQPGEVVRVMVSLNGVSTWGRYQDYQVVWPSGSMFSDPTRSYPLFLGE